MAEKPGSIVRWYDDRDVRKASRTLGRSAVPHELRSVPAGSVTAAVSRHGNTMRETYAVRLRPRPDPAHGTRADFTVLWLIKGLDYGGAEQLLVSFASHASPGGIRYEAAHVLDDAEALVPALTACGVSVSSLGARSTLDLRWPFRLFRRLRAEHVEIVHVHSPYPAILVRAMVRCLPASRRPALVTTDHIEISTLHPITRALYRLTYGLDDAHLAVSGRVRDSVPGRHRRNVEIVYQGIPVREVAQAGRERAWARRELGALDGDLLVGTVANMREQMGYPDLLTAAANVLRSASSPVRFVAIGGGPLLGEMRAAAGTKALDTLFRFLGPRADARSLIAGFDIFALASRYEGLPVALLEALALGVPVVATDVGGVREAVRGEEDGALLVPPADPVAFADAVLDLVADASRRERMAAAARRRSEEFDITQTVDRTERAYKRLISQRRR